MRSRTPRPFDPDTAIKAARGFHDSAALLENAHRLNFTRRRTHSTGQAYSPFEDTCPGAAVLEALALELALKIRLHRAGSLVPDLHKHDQLFARLSADERKATEQRYQAIRHPALRGTLEDVLKFSADVFETWRYPHEHQRLEMSMGEMRRAFAALADGL